eukprot:gnl/TRDRNA2_/TRDRNA2_85784_c1_seq2.p1 gnl/TRDRNA2_/TRDRNA2_85784_c1~~gnl/TRDRNA2_/TRDRNA2_85784_c1_seq2.p1  ORF type:complete len:353 (-),score=86.63 gnl/TRDRNA2_/TRDRNA2_85784_c1_seq2:81-1139(-)
MLTDLAMMTTFIFGMMRSSLYMAGGAAMLFGLCYCCARCRMRDCACIKRCLRCIGVDKFDDFEMMVLVHEALFTASATKMTTMVRITAGGQSVQTDSNSKGNFQQPLTILVEQGSATMKIDLLDSSKRVLATLSLDTLKDVLNADKAKLREHVFSMKTKQKGILNPRVKVTMVVNTGEDLEAPLLSGVSPEVDWLVRQELQKEGGAKGAVDEMTMISHGCRGSLDLFSGLGKTDTVWVSVDGPPTVKHWTMFVYDDEKDCQKRKNPTHEIEVLKIQSVQPDPGRSNVFVLTYFDKSSGGHASQKLVFRRIDRARDVWVEMLQLMVSKAHDQHNEKKAKKNNKSTSPAPTKKK